MSVSKLFIIGNGFDSAHGLAALYDEFRKYLCNTYMKVLFDRWVDDIDIEIAKVKQGFRSLIEREDIFYI